eukprot:scaffold101382_cov48-Phaeocystis_antarctica.AAC.1
MHTTCTLTSACTFGATLLGALELWHLCDERESAGGVARLRAEVRTRNLRRVVLLGVTFGTILGVDSATAYGWRSEFCSGSLLLVVHRLLHALTCHASAACPSHAHARRGRRVAGFTKLLYKRLLISKHKSMHKAARVRGRVPWAVLLGAAVWRVLQHSIPNSLDEAPGAQHTLLKYAHAECR